MDIFLTNVGPGPVRHVVITWEIIGINIQKLVIESGLFGVVTRSIDAGRIVAVNQDGHAFSKPIPTRSVSKIAKIYDGETMEIVPPKNFSTTWMVLALAETKNYNKNFEVSGDIWNAAKHENRIMTPIHVTIGYVNADGKSRNNSIRILAAIWPNVITRPLKPNKDGVYPLIKNATTAWVDNIQIVRD